MKIYRDLNKLPKIKNPVVTIGTFDGVHLGHQKILVRLQEIAAQNAGESVLVTFWPHPRLVLKPESPPIKLLSTEAEKQRLLASFGIDHLISIPFDSAFAATTSEDFIQQILVEKIGTQTLVIGYDHRFGKGREGGFEYLQANQKRFGFELEEISREDIDEIGISSTKVRHALESADLETAGNFLGRPYELSGTVIKGNQLGRELGYPTANISTSEPHKLIPKDGAYVVTVTHRGTEYSGMLNIGNRPTLTDSPQTIEVHLFDYEGDLYGETLEIHFLRYLRGEKKFRNLAELKTQLEQDKNEALAFFRIN
jgi:riboflavin kinase/FMN adenylyltransferase